MLWNATLLEKRFGERLQVSWIRPEVLLKIPFLSATVGGNAVRHARTTPRVMDMFVRAKDADTYANSVLRTTQGRRRNSWPVMCEADGPTLVCAMLIFDCAGLRSRHGLQIETAQQAGMNVSIAFPSSKPRPGSSHRLRETPHEHQPRHGPSRPGRDDEVSP